MQTQRKWWQFSLGNFLLANIQGVVVVRLTYWWHHWWLWRMEAGPSGSWFRESPPDWFTEIRERGCTYWTPGIAFFFVVSAYAIWFAIANRHDSKAVIAGISMTTPMLLLLGFDGVFFSACATLIALLTSLILALTKQTFLAAFVALFSICWAVFLWFYIGDVIVAFNI